MGAAPGPLFSDSLWIFRAIDPGSVLYIAPASPCCWRTSIRWDIKSESLWSQLLWRGLVGVTTHHQLGNIAFTHGPLGSEHNEESAEGDIFHFYYRGCGTALPLFPLFPFLLFLFFFPFFFGIPFFSQVDSLRMTAEMSLLLLCSCRHVFFSSL